MVNTHLLQVFVDSDDKFGDAASVVIDEGRKIPVAMRQAMALELNTGETAFINDLTEADISIVHPQGELGFAGVVVLGTARLLAQLRGKPTEFMHTRDGSIMTWQEGGLVWARSSLDIMPAWNYRQLDTPEVIEKLTVDDMKDVEHMMVWAWLDEAKGLIRARTFANDWEIPEAQGNGSGAMVLAAKLQRAIEIKHGRGSVIFAKPAPNGQADIGGRVINDDQVNVARNSVQQSV